MVVSAPPTEVALVSLYELCRKKENLVNNPGKSE